MKKKLSFEIGFLKNKFFFGWIIVFGLALLTRFFKLGTIPVGLTWDEAAIAYNGWSVWSIFRDEWLQLLPLSFRSFGDYKAPLAMYLIGPFVLAGGPSQFMIRLPFAVAGILSILAMGWLVFELLSLFKFSPQHKKQWSLFASFLMVLSPWHHHFSRVGFESGLALALTLIGLSLVTRWMRIQETLESRLSFKEKVFQFGLLPLGSVFLASSLYAYHSAKIVVPILGLFWFVRWFPVFKKNIFVVITAVCIGTLCLVPLGYDSFFRSGAERLQATILTQEKPWHYKLSLIVTQYGWHWSPHFLVQGGADSLRHSDGQWGVLLPTEFILFLIGLIGFVSLSWQDKKGLRQPWQNIARIGFVWIVVGLLPASLGIDGVLHPNRALLALPGFILVSGVGAFYAVSYIKNTASNKGVFGSHGEKDIVLKSIIGVWFMLHTLFFISYLHDYYTFYPAKSSSYFQSGYRELFEEVKKLQVEKSWDKIIISARYGQPYIYALLFQGFTPYQYHQGILIAYEFKPITVGDLDRKNALLVASPYDPESEWLPTPDKIIVDGAGQERFWLYLR